MDRILMLLFAALGALCMFAGYRLFCDLPILRILGSRRNWAALILLNIVPGAVLALFGAALFVTEARAMVNHRPDIHSTSPAEGTSLHHNRVRPVTHAA